MKSAAPIQTRVNEMVTKEATTEDLYASLTKKDASDNAAYKIDGVLFSAEEIIALYKKQYKDLMSSVLAANVTHVNLQI